MQQFLTFFDKFTTDHPFMSILIVFCAEILTGSTHWIIAHTLALLAAINITKNIELSNELAVAQKKMVEESTKLITQQEMADKKSNLMQEVIQNNGLLINQLQDELSELKNEKISGQTTGQIARMKRKTIEGDRTNSSDLFFSKSNLRRRAQINTKDEQEMVELNQQDGNVHNSSLALL